MSAYLQKIKSIGINHKHAELEVRERFALTQTDITVFYNSLTDSPIKELFILSTCNRTEFYAVCDDIQYLMQYINQSYTELNRNITTDDLEKRSGSEAIKHLFKVSAGMNSMMLGETQITSQIKTSFNLSKEYDGSGTILNRVIQSSLEAGKRVRTETSLSAGAISISYAAVEKINSIVSNISLLKILLIGAGSTGKLTASHFMKKGVSDFFIANRHPERGRKLAEETKGQFIPFENITQILKEVDIVVTCTGAPFPVITQNAIKASLPKGRSKILVDLSVPRNIHEDVGNIDGIQLFTIDEMESVVSDSILTRQKEIPKASSIVNAVFDELNTWLKNLQVTPTIADLKHFFEDVKDAELSKISNRYDQETISAINRFSSSLMRRILKDPISTLKSHAETGELTSGIVDTVRSIYKLDERNSEKKTVSSN